MIHPNFYIIGAPKCGTTALAAFLAEHPEIFFSRIKEPYFYLDESVNTTSRRKKDYESLFYRANTQHIAIGEGSTFYLYFEDTIKKLLKINQQSKFIVMIRNPLDAVLSAFCQKYKFYDKRRQEISSDFDFVWSILHEREGGKYLPNNCLGPYTYRYDEHYLYGKYLSQLFQLVPAEQIHIILFDDFKKNNLTEVSKCYEFLNVNKTYVPNLQLHNARFKLKRHFFLSLLSLIKVQSYPFLKNRYRINLFNQYIRRHFSEAMFDIHVSNETREKMCHHFYKDLEVACRLLQRNLMDWIK